MHFLVARLLAVICTLTFAFCAGTSVRAQGVPTSDEVRKAINAVNRRISDAFRNGDAASITELFAENGMIVLGKACFIGKTEVSQRMLTIFKEFGPAEKVHIQTTSLSVEGEFAIESGSWTHTYPAKPASMSVLEGRYVVIWARQPDGEWKILRDIRLPMRP